MNKTKDIISPGTLFMFLIFSSVFACGDLNVGSGGGDFFIPSVNTEDIIEVGSDFVKVSGEVTYDGEADVSERGFVWSKEPEPSVDDGLKITEGMGEGTFESTITDLEPGETYFVRAFATNEIGTGYGSEIEFTTEDEVLNQLPDVQTIGIEQIGPDSARVSGEIRSDGGSEVISRGFVWDTSTDPSTNLPTKVEVGDGLGEYSSSIQGLAESTTYYVRGYAVNAIGTAYGNELSFTTEGSNRLPTLTTREITEVTAQSARSGGQITDAGSSEILDKGIAFDTSPTPTVESAQITSNGQGNESFQSSLLNLEAETQYYVRAFATNDAGTAYGNELSFTTLAEESGTLPSVQTADVIAVTDTSAISGGNVTDDGNLQVTARGVVWSLNPNPEIGSASFSTDGSGRGSFVSVLTNLFPSTQYYIRAYATNDMGTAYGPQLEFTTQDD